MILTPYDFEDSPIPDNYDIVSEFLHNADDININQAGSNCNLIIFIFVMLDKICYFEKYHGMVMKCHTHTTVL